MQTENRTRKMLPLYLNNLERDYLEQLACEQDESLAAIVRQLIRAQAKAKGLKAREVAG